MDDGAMGDNRADQRKSRQESFIAAIFLCLMLLICWARLPWSAGLWLDETLSAWTISDGLSDTWNRSIYFQTQSPLFYLLEWCFKRFCGGTEVSLRAISILAALGSLWVVTELAKRLSGSLSVGLYAGGFLLGCDVFQVGAVTARPYSLATLCALASISTAYTLRERYSHGRALAWSVAATLTWYAHYLFIVVELGNLILWSRRRGLNRKMLPWMVAVALACLPGMAHFFQLYERSSGMFFTVLPGARDIFGDIIPIPVMVAVIVGLLMAYIWGGRVRLDARLKEVLLTLLPYLISPLLCFGMLTIVAGGAVWLPRYWEWQVGVFVISVALVLGHINNDRIRSLGLMVTALFVVARASLQVWHTEGWEKVGRIAREYQGPVALFSGLIEAETAAGRGKPEFNEYLRAPLSIYGRSQDVEVIRLSATDEELRAFLSKPLLLVAARKRVGRYESPERFLNIATSQGREVIPIFTEPQIITAYEIR